MDTAFFLTLIIILVSLVILSVGVYLILVLRDVRGSLQKLNHILDHTESLVDTLDSKIAKPASSIVGILAAVKEGLTLFSSLRDKKREDHE